MPESALETAARAASPLLGREERVSVEVEGLGFEVVALTGEEGVSQLFRYELVCLAPDDALEPASLLAKRAAVTLRDGAGALRVIRGLVAEAFSAATAEGSSELTLVVRPVVFPLTLTRDAYVLHDVDVVDVLKDVLDGFPGPVRYELVGTYPKRPYCAQYREDDFTFLSRLLEEEGIYYWFDHRGDDTTLVFSDTSTSAPDLDGGAHIAFAHESGMNADREVVDELGSELRAAPGKFTVASFDPARPALSVSATTGEGPLEIYHARGANPESPAVCAARARTMAEGARAAAHTVAGSATSVRLSPGMVFSLVDHPLSRLDGSYFLTAVTIEVVQRRRGAVGPVDRPYRCHFRAVRREVPFRPPHVTPLAKQAGLQTGFVVGADADEVMPDQAGRVRVQLHWDRIGRRNEAAGKWMRVAQRGTESSMLLPRVGWTVLVFNEEGSVDAPNVLSRIFDGEHPPPYALPANKTRVVFKTATTPGGDSFNEIHFEDMLGAEKMLINASKDMNVFVQNLKNDFIHGNQVREIGNDHALSVASSSLESVGGNHQVSIGGDESLAVAEARAKTVSGDETATIGGNRTLRTGQGHETAVAEDRTLEVGSSLVETTTGGFSAVAAQDLKLTIGGAQMKVSKQSITTDVGKKSELTIGGMKYESAKDRRVLDVRKTLTESISGGMTLATKKRYVDHANTTSTWRVAAQASTTAPDVWIEAKDRIELRCGESVVVVLPDSVEIRAASFDLSEAAHLEAETTLVEHNG